MNQQTCGKCSGQLRRDTRPMYREEGLGLPVILMNAVEVKVCVECGEVFSKRIPDLQNLIAAMAVARVMDPSKLNGRDIRFLRKAINSTAKDLASRLGVAEGTFSRWENDKDVIGLANEKLLRMIAGVLMHEDAPAVDFDAERIASMEIEAARPIEDMDTSPMCFERVRFKRPSHPKENQWDTTEVLPPTAKRAA